ncbi:MAG: thiamine diphosphokinase [Bacilli bacterium]|nr:thiamine diphosphokinase [Bacilli bacterium]MDD4076754.1 thiamine diphosphokinase [Bacilli bacterium]MDD4388375.1 thiamine diphosphokinase [Bacilli bacterium]
MIIKIVSAGPNGFKKLYHPDADEFLVGVDGGIYNIVEKGLKVDLAVGDFDSCNIEEVIIHCSKVKFYPEKKDLSDLELAVQEVLPMKSDKIEIYNATGGRIDHFIAALNVIISYSDYNIEMFDERNHICIIRENTIFKKSKYKYCSFFAIENDTIISLSGFKYQLNKYHLHPFDNRCLSNEIVQEEAQVTLNGKRLLVIETL